MSLVENIISQISTQGLNGTSGIQNFDLSDNTFSKLLDKQMEVPTTSSLDNSLGQLGIPAGMFIESFDGSDFSDLAKDQLEIIGETKLTNEFTNEPIQFKDIDMDDYFSKLIKTNTNSTSDFMNFAKRQATNAYDVFGKNFVVDIKDFVNDIASNVL